MNQPAISPAVMLKRGMRTLDWLTGRSCIIWGDSVAGRIALAFARMTGRHCETAWQGPLWARQDRRAVPLAWFSVPRASASPTAFVHAIDDALTQQPDAGTAPDVVRLMARVRDTHALDPAHRTPRGSTPRRTTTTSERVLFIDERASVAHDSRTARARRAAFARMLASARVAHPHAQFWLVRSGASGCGRWLS